MIYNFKNLGQGQVTKDGKTIKQNSLCRTAFIKPNEENKLYIENLGISTIFDFRGQHEIESDPNFDSFEVKYYPLSKRLNEEVMKSNNLKFQAPDMESFYKLGFIDCEYLYDAVRDIVINPRPLLYHCTAGKDRTGVYSIILMHMLGFKKEAIKADYLVIDPKFIEHAREKFKQLMPDVDDEQFESIITVKPEYFDSFYDSIVENYGSFDNYITNFFRLSDSEIEKFKQYYLV